MRLYLVVLPFVALAHLTDDDRVAALIRPLSRLGLVRQIVAPARANHHLLVDNDDAGTQMPGLEAEVTEHLATDLGCGDAAVRGVPFSDDRVSDLGVFVCEVDEL